MSFCHLLSMSGFISYEQVDIQTTHRFKGFVVESVMIIHKFFIENFSHKNLWTSLQNFKEFLGQRIKYQFALLSSIQADGIKILSLIVKKMPFQGTKSLSIIFLVSCFTKSSLLIFQSFFTQFHS
ncbi:MAG: hypothetical protein LBQ24_01885 [Candidatus Peribacteria bacterium]|jgi:hypothetical protein|nr:hypothetical protein [Candidatus Peribacteria bacterium]